MSSSEIISAWKDSTELRAEFQGDFGRYLSYCDAVSKGLVRIVNNKTL